MKNLHSLTAVLVAFSLPLGLAAQSSRTPPSPANQAPTNPGSRPDATMPDAGDNMANGQVEHITKSTLDDELTAKDLIGKAVYDRNDKKIGKVSDLVLGNQNSALSGASASGHGWMHSSESNGSTNTATSASSSNYSATGSSGTANGMTSNGANSSAAMSTESGQPYVVIEQGNLLLGNRDFIRVPLTELSYDSSQKHLKLDLTENELGNSNNSSQDNSTKR
ncbi:MAG TPA: PRC-barrel domain-containing protein [Candidatus Didemnitutus sp.]|nr:PRC-barrel domain-containing protein [Candidatus Didemnitutus sp.]